MKKHKTYNMLVIIFLSSLIFSGAGYVGDLPNIDKSFTQERKLQQEQEVKVNKEDILPLAPKLIPVLYKSSIVNSKKYISYQKQMDKILPLIEKLKISIKNQDDIQQFNANANTFNLYILKLQEKFAKKPEHAFESYKAIISLNESTQNVAEYWIEANKRIKFISHYKSYNSYTNETIREQLTLLNNKIEETIILIKESQH